MPFLEISTSNWFHRKRAVKHGRLNTTSWFRRQTLPKHIEIHSISSRLFIYFHMTSYKCPSTRQNYEYTIWHQIAHSKPLFHISIDAYILYQLAALKDAECEWKLWRRVCGLAIELRIWHPCSQEADPSGMLLWRLSSWGVITASQQNKAAGMTTRHGIFT